MPSYVFPLVELFMVFVPVFIWGTWELRKMKRMREEDARRKERGEPPL